MKLIGLLCFYDERPEELVSCVLSLKEIGVDHLVACDGAYALYPDGKPSSPSNQHAALHLACREAGIGLTLHVPSETWVGNEIDKRTTLFELGWTVASRGDWFVVMDADQIVIEHPEDLKRQLYATEEDVAIVTFCDAMALEANTPTWPPYFTVRIFFRAQPIHLVGNHFTYVGEDGLSLWAGGDTLEGSTEEGFTLNRDPGATSCLNLINSFTVLHVPNRRDPERQRAKLGFYVDRDASGIELTACACGRRARETLATNWRLVDGKAIDCQIEVCERCAKRVRRRNDRQLKALGVRVSSYQWVQGKAPEPEQVSI